jgi:hypothetical protein
LSKGTSKVMAKLGPVRQHKTVVPAPYFERYGTSVLLFPNTRDYTVFQGSMLIPVDNFELEAPVQTCTFASKKNK